MILNENTQLCFKCITKGQNENFHSSSEAETWVLCCKLLLSDIIIIQNASLGPHLPGDIHRQPVLQSRSIVRHAAPGPRLAVGGLQHDRGATTAHRNINQPAAFQRGGRVIPNRNDHSQREPLQRTNCADQGYQ